MNYSVQDLRDNLNDKILSLGINREFLNNPAYKAVLTEIDNMIGQLNMFEQANNIMVESTGNSISFKFTGADATNYYTEISKNDDKTFKCFQMIEKKPYLNVTGDYVKEKTFVEEIATLTDKGFIELVNNGAIINNTASSGVCNNMSWAEKKTYTNKGIMQEREYIGFPRGELNESYDRANSATALYFSKSAFNGSLGNLYDTKTILRRDKLDTARIYVENKNSDFKYSAIIPLNQEHGLRDMTMIGGYDSYPTEIVIKPLSPEEITAIISKEPDLKIQEGLKEYAVGRENYYYNSLDDPYFIYQQLSNNQNITR